MVYNTQYEDSSIEIRNYLNDIEQKKEFKSTSIPTDKNVNRGEEILKNPFMDISLRELIDDFVLTWHKIIFDLMEYDRYAKLKEGEIWDKIKASIHILLDVFWVENRIFFVGIGFIILSFFVFFITVTN